MKAMILSLIALAVGVVTANADVGKQAVDVKLGDAPASARLITQEQYINTMRSAFGNSLRYPLQLAPVKRVGGLVALGAGSAVVTAGALDKYDAAARSIAAQIVDPSRRDHLLPCRPSVESEPDDACAGQVLGQVGRLLYRRKIAPAELSAYVGIAHNAAVKLGGFYAGLSSTLAGMMVAPEFLLVAPTTETSGGETRLTAYAKAAKLSLMLWNAYPDAELLSAAEDGSINSEQGLAMQVDRLLESPRFADGIRSFFDDLMFFEEFGTLSKDSKIYPVFTSKVTTDAREQTLRTIVSHIVTEDADYRDLFTSRKTFLSNDLGAVYGVGISSPGRWVPYEFPATSHRAGILTQVSFLALHSHPGRSSPTRRGRAIREIFLCQPVPQAPPNVDFSKLEDPDPNLKTSRERLAAHRANPVCAGCHKITDPMGLALENFEGDGEYRTHENGAAIDATGQLDAAKFDDAEGLGIALRNNPRTVSCIAERMASFALGRELRPGDRDWLAHVGESFAADGYRIKSLLRTIATDSAFYEVPSSTDEPESSSARSVITKSDSDLKLGVKL